MMIADEPSFSREVLVLQEETDQNLKPFFISLTSCQKVKVVIRIAIVFFTIAFIVGSGSLAGRTAMDLNVNPNVQIIAITGTVCVAIVVALFAGTGLFMCMNRVCVCDIDR